MAAKHSPSSAAPAGLFDSFSAPAAPAPVRVPVSRLTPEQQSRVRLVSASLERDIERFQQQLARPLASWQDYDHQAIEANAALAFAFKAVVEFLPADLQALVSQFVDLRAQVVTRLYEEG
jgi:hypothetical protein